VGRLLEFGSWGWGPAYEARLAATFVLAGACVTARGALEPLKPTEDTPVARMNSVAVAARIRLGVNHVA
jgi:hypothetical protein